MDLGSGKGWHCGIVGIARVPAQRPPRQMHSNGIWEAFPGVLGGDAEVPAKSSELGSSGLGRGLP